MSKIEELKQIESKIDEILNKYVDEYNQINLEEIVGDDADKLAEYCKEQKKLLIEKLKSVEFMFDEFDE